MSCYVIAVHIHYLNTLLYFCVSPTRTNLSFSKGGLNITNLGAQKERGMETGALMELLRREKRSNEPCRFPKPDCALANASCV